MRVAGRGYRDGVRNLEVMLESLSGGRRREIQKVHVLDRGSSKKVLVDCVKEDIKSFGPACLNTIHSRGINEEGSGDGKGQEWNKL